MLTRQLWCIANREGERAKELKIGFADYVRNARLFISKIVCCSSHVAGDLLIFANHVRGLTATKAILADSLRYFFLEAAAWWGSLEGGTIP
jgi:hypothetical protein